MFTIRKARIDDCGLINQMAGEVFPATYQEILSPGQLDYMMDWMYSPENIRKQMEEEGHVYFIAYEEMSPVAMSPYSNRKRMYSICRKSMSSPIFKAHTAVVFYSERLSDISRRCIRNLA